MSFSPSYIKHVLGKSFLHWAGSFLDEFDRQNKAHLVMLAKQKIVDGETASELKKAMDTLAETLSIPKEFPEGVEDLFFYYEKQLEGLIGEKAGSLHTARSRNDMDTAVFRLYTRKILLWLLERTVKLAIRLLAKIKGSHEDLLVLYTHGQPAQVSTLAHYLGAFLLELLEGLEGLSESVSVVNQSPLGAGAITTSGYNIDRDMVAELLGFDRPVPSSYQAIVTSHWLTYPAMWLKSVLIDVTRLMADLSHKASCEVGMLDFPDELVQVSSIMPQKRNPVIVEHVRIQSGLACGDFQGLIDLFHNTPYQDVNEVADAPLVNLTRGCETFIGVVELLEEMLLKISVNERRVEEIASTFGTTTTELADELVRRERISFRTAHRVTSAYVKSHYSFDTLKSTFEQLTGRTLKLEPQELTGILSLKHFVEVRNVPGGPSELAMESVIRVIEAKVKKLTTTLEELENKIEMSAVRLEREYRDLAKWGGKS